MPTRAIASVVHPNATGELRLEGTSYGGWTYNATGLNADSIVYSVGIGEDTSWDLGMHRTHGLHIWGFDPTPRAAKHVALHMQGGWFHFTNEGLSTKRGDVTFTLPQNPQHVSMREGVHRSVSNRTARARVDTLSNWMQRHGHTRLDILKMDIEGSEYNVLDDWVARRYFPFSQLLVEFHHRFDSHRGKNRHRRVLAGLHANGFEVLVANTNEQEVTFQHRSRRPTRVTAHRPGVLGTLDSAVSRMTTWLRSG
jgi:FkbM family methyltransferase